MIYQWLGVNGFFQKQHQTLLSIRVEKSIASQPDSRIWWSSRNMKIPFHKMTI